ncbi:transcription elongation factor TFIIS/CRSP70 [Tanacetum coccineum]
MNVRYLYLSRCRVAMVLKQSSLEVHSDIGKKSHDVPTLIERYQQNSCDLSDFIKKMIKLAATDRPVDFQVATSEEKSVMDQEEQKQDVSTSRPQQSFKVTIKVKKAETDSGKDNIAKGPVTPEQKVENSTNVIDEKLQHMVISIETPEKTGIGKTVSLLRKHVSKEVGENATKLFKAWKDIVDESLKKKSSIAKPISENQTSQHCKQIDSDVKTATSTNFEKKLEASRRKMQNTYNEFESMKKKRKIQVLQLHQLPPQDHRIKPDNKRFKRCTNMRC